MKFTRAALITTIGFSTLLAIPDRLAAQQAGPIATPNTVIHGQGTRHSLAKFTGQNSIGDSAIVEAGGNLTTTDNITAKALSATINKEPGIAIQGTNNTNKGSKKQDAALLSGIRGVVGHYE